MGKLRIHNFAISVDGYGAGPGQSRANPLGAGGQALHGWAVATQTFQSMLGKSGGATGIDDGYIKRGFSDIGAWILGRNMFGPIRGAWPDDKWKGWWGDNPPYHTPVFVLTNHPRPPIVMDGGTTFHFVADGTEAALQRGLEAANGLDVRLGGGVGAIRQYLTAALVDEMHLAVTQVLLGSGEHLLGGIDLLKLGYRVTEHVASAKVTHIVVAKTLGETS